MLEGVEVLHKMVRILVADDSSVAREVVSCGIGVHRATRYIEVETACNGRAALDILRTKRIDLAFIDVNMPGLSGPEVLDALAGTQSSRCVAVMMSGGLDERVEAAVRRLGAYHFLKKPFRPDEVSEIVSTYVKMTTTYPILIVDDSATMRKLAIKMLKGSRFDFEISEADGAQAALRALAAGKFRLVLTDFHMPGCDGLELAGAIRNLSSKIGIYMMSTNDTSFLERSAAFVGISGFLKKPFTPEDIDIIMHGYLGLEPPKFGKDRDMFSFLAREKKVS